MPTERRSIFAAVVLVACLGACSHANFGPPVVAPTASASASGSPQASASPSASATPAAACGTPVPGAIYIAAGSYIEPETDPTYGVVYGYSLVDTNGNYPLEASPLVLRPSDTVQFTDVDPPTASDANGTSHSAAGLQTNSFPTPHTFPAAATSEVGTTFSASVLWSTGEIPAEAQGLCYSQAFTVPAAGTFYFGDLDFYNSVNMRDVIVVSSSAAQ